ncbi:MAG TPA: GAF domain-containing protein [Thermoanaerobaculia bacterium]|nr:GAF domain-containing protein [Thermoanaerobaculia bacterium]
MKERIAALDPGHGGRRSASPTATGLELAAELRSALARAGELARCVELNLREAAAAASAAGGEAPAGELAALERRLATAESDVKELASRLVESEHQGGRLMNLYVATYQLHATLDPAEVQATIAEIAINLLGAAQFVLLLRRDDGDGCEIAFVGGIDRVLGDAASRYAGEVYRGGDAMVDATLADGLMRFGPEDGSPALAAVPLRVQHDVVGALVLLKLLDHKPTLRAEDRDLLDLLSAHAASALFAARLFASKDRKLRTLESLVKLARGE